MKYNFTGRSEWDDGRWEWQETPRREGYTPRHEGYTPRHDGYTSRHEGHTPRHEGYSSSGRQHQPSPSPMLLQGSPDARLVSPWLGSHTPRNSGMFHL